MDSVSFYTKCFHQFGPEARAVGWQDRYRQRRRFQIFCDYYNFDNKSVLDIGSGLGDFYDYLKQLRYLVDYIGIDSCEVLVKSARLCYPLAFFEYTRLDQYNPDRLFDCVVASGTFSYKALDPIKFLKFNLQYAYQLTKSCFLFNFLSTKWPLSNQFNRFYYYDMQMVQDICDQLLPKPQFVKLITNYLDGDVTVIIEK